MMIKDIASAQEAMPDWETYQKGLEALALALGSAKGSEEGTKKALTINDLLVKVPFCGLRLFPAWANAHGSLFRESANTPSCSANS